MYIQDFNDAIGKIMGVKAGVEWCLVNKAIDTGKVTVSLKIIANENQIKKIIPLILNHKKEES